MTTELATAMPTPDPKTGLTPLLSKSLGSQDLSKHRAMIALELEVLAKKMDRFGWDRDRGSAAHDRIVTDWMDALHDYPLAEVKAACSQWVEENPRRMPNEGDIKSLIVAARRSRIRSIPAPEPERDAPCSPEAAEEICKQYGFRPKRLGGGAK